MMSSERGRVAQMVVGALLVLSGGLIWATQNADAAGAAMVGAGATMLPATFAANKVP